MKTSRIALIWAAALAVAAWTAVSPARAEDRILKMTSAGLGTEIEVDMAEIRAAYEFDRSAPLNVVIEKEAEFLPSCVKISFSYDSPNGGRVPASLIMPKPHIGPMNPARSTVEGALPAVFFMHFHVSDKSLADVFAPWTGHGIAIMAIDGVYRGDRAEKGKDVLMDDPALSAKHMQEQIRDILRGFDVLASWKGIDPGRLGYMGISMGALTGTAATSLDPRIKSILLADGGADFSLMFRHSDYGDMQEIRKYMETNNMSPEQFVDMFKFVDPGVFAPLLNDRAVMLMNGKNDTTISVPAMEALHNLIDTPRKGVVWYDSDHILPLDKVVVDSLKWFKKSL
ncbi:MAG: Alpha/beta hydrolase family protein [bacterium ADurb.Bin236]|nr:MAG: Alpha/beta hydrolase family protein [bacterium ADurb.Bin236]